MKIHELKLVEQETEQQLKQQVRQYAQYIIRDCEPFLNEWGWGQGADFIYRGINKVNDPFIKRDVRSDRKPMDTPQVMHDAADEWFIKHFNYPYRSAGLFTTGNFMEADSYGTNYMIFPIGQFSYVWSPVYELLFIEMDQAYERHLEDRMPGSVSINDAHQVLDPILEDGDYQHNMGLDHAINSGNEILFACKQFYGVRVDQSNVDTIADALLYQFAEHP